MWPCAKQGTPVFVVTSFSSLIFLLPLFPIFLCPSLTSFFPLIGLYCTQFSFFNTIYPPLSALHAFTLPSNTSSPNRLPLYLHKNGDNSRGKFIRSKNKRNSVSVLLSWHVPQGCSVLWMVLSAHFVWGSVYMLAHLREAHTPFPKDAQKAVITSILQHCYCCYPHSSQSGIGPFLQ